MVLRSPTLFSSPPTSMVYRFDAQNRLTSVRVSHDSAGVEAVTIGVIELP
jgi:hypothetical protein